MKNIDMHFHTTLSDGQRSNKEIIEMINPKGIDLIVATEHDIVNDDFKKTLEDLGISTAYGVEVSACDYTDKKSMHILHYSKEINHLLEPKLECIRTSREFKILKQVEKLRNNGFYIDYNDMIDFFNSKGSNISNLVAYDIAEYIFKEKQNITLIEKVTGKKNMSIHNFYIKFLKRGGEFANLGHFEVGNYEFDINELSSHKLESSIFSLAHPNITFKNDIDAFAEKIEKLVPLGINAIEVNTMTTKKWLDVITYFSHKYDLILTFGSDCHFRDDYDGKHGQLFEINQELSKKQIEDNMYRIKDKLLVNF